MWDWLVTHCGKYMTTAATIFPKLFVALVTEPLGWVPK